MSEPAVIVIDDHDGGEGGGEYVTELAIDGVRSGYVPGDPVRLVAVQDPATEHEGYEWFRRSAGSEAWEPVAGAAGAELVFTAWPEDDGVRFLLRLVDGARTVLGESAAVTALAGGLAALAAARRLRLS